MEYKVWVNSFGIKEWVIRSSKDDSSEIESWICIQEQVIAYMLGYEVI